MRTQVIVLKLLEDARVGDVAGTVVRQVGREREDVGGVEGFCEMAGEC